MKALILVLSTLAALTGHAFGDPGIYVERVQLARPGDHVIVTIRAIDSSGTLLMGGFDFTIRHDSSLARTGIQPGQFLTLCHWEYFTYQPTGLYDLQVTAIADINNGDSHPACYGAPYADLVDLAFDIPLDYSLYGTFLPVRFIWKDCGDNAVSSRHGDTLFTSDRVFAFDGYQEYDITRDSAFPTPYGAPSSCENADSTRWLDFHNGGVSLIQEDLIPPVAICPADTTVAAAPGECGAFVSFIATVTDNRAGAVIGCSPPPGTFFPVGSHIINCYATDAAGNQDICQFTITVVDNEPPALTLPTDTAIANTPGQCQAKFYYTVTADDNCGSASITCSRPSGSTFYIGTTDVTVTATDPAGNRTVDTFSVTVEDRQFPVVNHPASVTVPNTPGVCGAWVDYTVTASDNCPGPSLLVEPPSGTLFPIGTIPVRVIAADALGNTDTSFFMVTVIDTEPPVLLPVDTIRVAADPGSCSAVVSFYFPASDNCAVADIVTSIPPGSSFPVGTTEIEAIAYDPAGNADTAHYYIAVRDAEPPSITPLANLTLPTAPGECTAVALFDGSAADNCGYTDLTFAPPSGSVFPLGLSTVLAVATDQCGNADTASFSVSVVDAEPPVIACPDDIVATTDPGAYNARVPFDPDASDNCGTTVIQALPPSGSTFPLGITPVLVWASDPSGSADTCTFTVTVLLEDPDSDNIPSWNDNCPLVANPLQIDTDSDGIGDACCCTCRGDVDGHGTSINVADLTYLVAYLMQNGPRPPCPEHANVNASASSEESPGITVSDLTSLVRFLFRNGPPPPPCN